MSKPYIVCHMMATLDGRIDCPVMAEIGSDGYYEALKALNVDTTFEGRVTAQADYAEKEPFVPKDATLIGKEEWYRSHDSEEWHVVTDTRGTLRWPEDDNEHRLCLLSQQASKEYIQYLRENGISYVVCGEKQIDILRALDILTEHFGTQRVGVVGGGRLNGTFLKMGLIDEVSMVYAPAIDGRAGQTAAFDGIEKADIHPYMLRLHEVRRMDDDSVWMQYEVKK